MGMTGHGMVAENENGLCGEGRMGMTGHGMVAGNGNGLCGEGGMTGRWDWEWQNMEWQPTPYCLNK
jgi:hypothetical protein